MSIKDLNDRSAQLSDAITKTTQQVFVLQGHKAEVDYQLKIAMEAAAEAEKAAAETLANESENPVV